MTTTGEVPAPVARGRGRIPADTFAARLVLSRMHASNVTIREAARQCGLNYASWSNWERGMEPRNLIEVVDRIAAGLDVDRNWLLFGGPLAQAEENRDRWRPALAVIDRGDTAGYPISAGRALTSIPLSRPAQPFGQHENVSPDGMTLARAA